MEKGIGIINRNKFIKIAIFIIIFIIICSPIISSTSTLQFQIKDKTQQKKYTNNVLNPKITEILDKINETLLQKYMRDLMDIGRRMTGTYGCNKAAKYIYAEFKKLNLNPKMDYWNAFGDNYHKGFYKSQNVEATHKGIDETNDEILMFNAHYDTVRNAPGANDDGSGTVAVLAAAYVLSQYEFNRTIKFVAFSGEEEGLLGSRDYVKKIYSNDENIFLDINADMIGRAVTAEGGRNMGIGATEDSLWILNLIENISTEYGMNFYLRTYQIDRDADRGYSDYWGFVQYGYESIACWGSSDGDPNYHSENDNYDNINFSYLVNTTRHIVGTLAYLADFENPNPQIKITNPKKGRLYYKDRIFLDFYMKKLWF